MRSIFALLLAVSMSSPAMAASPMGPGQTVYRLGWVQFGGGVLVATAGAVTNNEAALLAGSVIGGTSNITMNVGARMAANELRDAGFRVTRAPSSFGIAATGICIAGSAIGVRLGVDCLGSVVLPAVQMGINQNAIRYYSFEDLGNPEEDFQDSEENDEENEPVSQSFEVPSSTVMQPTFGVAPLATGQHVGLVVSGTF